MLENAIVKDYEITVKVEFECPHCGFLQKLESNISAYTSFSDDPFDDMCQNPDCEEFLTIQV